MKFVAEIILVFLSGLLYSWAFDGVERSIGVTPPDVNPVRWSIIMTSGYVACWLIHNRPV
jgi:hypothetical protein